MPAEPRTGGKPPAAPVDHLIVDGKRLPCYVKVAVYQGGQAAGLGIKTTNPAFMAAFLREPDGPDRLRAMLRKQIDKEMGGQGITFGVKDDEVQAAVNQFVESCTAGQEQMATRKIAEGQPAEQGEDAFLEYPLNPGGQPLYKLGKLDRITASEKVNRLKEGDVLVVRHPPRSGQKGCNVRGEPVEPREPRDVSIESVAGTNTAVVDEKLVAAITGVYREDERGRIHVVQEVFVDEVNAGTGDLPRTGIATTNFSIRKGVRGGSGVMTTEDVFVGEGREAGALDKDTRIRARNLVVKGQVAGGQLPAAYLSGEVEAMEEAERRKIDHLLERSQVEVSGLFAAREVLGRNVSAQTLLVQTHSLMSALDSEGDICVDGNLAGGRVSFGRRLQVRGNLGDAGGGPTRIRIGVENRQGQKRDQFKADIQSRKAKLEELAGQLDTHKEGMERHAKKSPYWAALLKGEKRAPQGPVESRILVQFFQAAKQRARLEQAVEDCRREIADMGQVFDEMQEEQAEEGSSLSVIVGGIIHPGVLVEVVHPLDASEMGETASRKVAGRVLDQHPVALQEIRRDLAKDVNDYLVPRAGQIEERRQALDQMFKGREQRPQAPEIPNRRFEIELVFGGAEETGPERKKATEVRRIPCEGLLVVNSRDPQKFILRRTWTVNERLKDTMIFIEKADQGWAVQCAPNRAPLVPWQEDRKFLDQMETIQVMGQSARNLLLGSPTQPTGRE